jgi:hypothetical protein
MYPPAFVIHLNALLSACMRGVMLPLGDRVRPPRYAPPRELLPERLVVVVQRWLMKRQAMIAVLMERIAAGNVRQRAFRPREPKPDAVAKPRAEIPPENFLPRGFGWIRRLAPEIGAHAEGLSRLLEEPEMQAMVLGAPQMARAWVPLLNAVGERKPEWWPKPPPRPRRPRPRAQKLVAAGLDPATAPLPANPTPQPQMGTWFPPQPPPPPPRRITSWRDFVDSMRPVSQNFEPPPSDWVVVRPTPGKPGF